MRNNIIIGINLGDFGSTGNIMRNSLEYANEHGDFDYLVVVPKSSGKQNTYPYLESNNLIDKIDRRLFHKSLGNPDGLYEYRATRRIIRVINKQSKKYNKILIHLHNLHMASIDFRVLFKYISKKKEINKVFYTIHDEWPFTGACYYTYVHGNKLRCDKWINGCCGNCPQYYGTETYSVTEIWKLKNKYTLLLKDKLVLLPVSNWIDGELSKSFLKKVDRIVINGETNITNLGYKDLELVNKLSLNDKKIILTVSAYWNNWKGADYIYKVADRLPNDYVVLIVGGKFDVKEYKNIIHVKEVSNSELNHYYSISDVYMSTSQAESLGLTTCEAQICGIPVVAFGHTAIKETIVDGKTGILVGEDNDVDRMVKDIVEVVETKPFKYEDIINNGNRFAKNSCSKKYFDLYNEAVN